MKTFNPIYKTFDGKIFTDENKAIAHYQIIDPMGISSMELSLDEGDNWDWEFGYPNGNGGWHRRMEK